VTASPIVCDEYTEECRWQSEYPVAYPYAVLIIPGVIQVTGYHSSTDYVVFEKDPSPTDPCTYTGLVDDSVTAYGDCLEGDCSIDSWSA